MKIPQTLIVERIAHDYPETLKVLARHRIDLCCGGKLPLEEVARRHQLDLVALLRELEQAVGSGERASS